MLARRKPLGDISNEIQNEKRRCRVIEAEKDIAETMYHDAFKEKELIRVQSVKTFELLKNRVKRSEDALVAATATIASNVTKIENNLVINVANECKIHDLEKEISAALSASAELESVIFLQKNEIDACGRKMLSMERSMKHFQNENKKLIIGQTVAEVRISEYREKCDADLQISKMMIRRMDDLTAENDRLSEETKNFPCAKMEHAVMIDTMRYERDQIVEKCMTLQCLLDQMCEEQRIQEAMTVQGALTSNSSLACQLPAIEVLDVSGLSGECSEKDTANENPKFISDTSDASYAHRIHLLKSKLSMKVWELCAERNLRRNRDIDLNEVAMKMKSNREEIEEQILELENVLDMKDKELTALKIDGRRKSKELNVLTDTLEDAHENIVKIGLECSNNSKEKATLYDQCEKLKVEIEKLKINSQTEISEMSAKYARSYDILAANLVGQEKEHSATIENLKNLLQNVREEKNSDKIAYAQLMRELNNRILDKESETLNLLRSEKNSTARLHESLDLISNLQNTNVSVSCDNEKRTMKMNELETSAYRKCQQLTDEYIALCATFNEKNTESVTLQNEVEEKSVAIEELESVVENLQMQLRSGGELVADLENQVNVF